MPRNAEFCVLYLHLIEERVLELIEHASGSQTNVYLVSFVLPPVLLTVLFRFVVCSLCYFL